MGASSTPIPADASDLLVKRNRRSCVEVYGQDVHSRIHGARVQRSTP